MKSLIDHINEILPVKLNQEHIIETAFRHTSFVNEHTKLKLESNERLEFLGDAVLELVVSKFLYQYYPDQPEGFLTRTRATLVQEDSLAFLAKKYHFDQFIRLGHGEKMSGGDQRKSILSDCFEAFLGAVYLDQGYEVVEQFLKEALLENHQAVIQAVNKDYKTLLQEKLQSQGSVVISYRVLSQEGPAHNQTFESGVFLDDQLLAKGKGKSKKQAERQAAKIAYHAIMNR
ncbi:ribonuclease III [Hutsoniella sourekii]|uniref:ribonuclease III n=1 Tax=Hutsoniella sourekii TaxID=87650 RepID=UPI000487A396|nr:ribonuclease III [Hutsoniella sourekii]